LTKKEAIRQVVKHAPLHPVPHHIRFTNAALEKYRLFKAMDFDPIRDGGAYIVASHTNHGWKEIKPGYWNDYFGVTWNKTYDTTLGIVENHPIKNPSLKDFEFPDPENIPVYDFIHKNNLAYPDHFHTLSIGFAIFERAWSLVGMEQLMIWFMLEPAFVHDLLDEITEYNIALIRNASEIGGVDAVYIGDDWGGQHGLLISPDLWREFIKPRYQKICDTAHRRGMFVILHSCGKVEDLVPDLIKCGTDIFNPFQPEVMDIWKLKKQYQDKLAFWGGLSVQQTLPNGTPGDVIKEGRKLLYELGRQGGYIFSPSHALTADIPAENIDALIDMANNQETLKP
jgi:uroporphyrinogen decarboxylase